MTRAHAQDAARTMQALSVDSEKGPGAAEIRRRREEHGANRLRAAETASP